MGSKRQLGQKTVTKLRMTKLRMTKLRTERRKNEGDEYPNH
jgi:hypothetical protein